jgi:hypothetical protein
MSASELTDSNCFSAVQRFFDKNTRPSYLGPQDFVNYLNSNFIQIDQPRDFDVTVVWSRSEDKLPIGEIRTQRLSKEVPGYPFGLVIEHAFVNLESGRVFQKKDRATQAPYEEISTNEALLPYLERQGFELTHHRKLDYETPLPLRK